MQLAPVGVELWDSVQCAHPAPSPPPPRLNKKRPCIVSGGVRELSRVCFLYNGVRGYKSRHCEL